MRAMMTVLVLVAACRSSDRREVSSPQPDPADTGPTNGSEDAGTPKESPESRLRDGVRDFVALAERCDREHFAHVDPERIKRWELPVNVKAMEGECDALLTRFEDLMGTGTLRHPALDRFLARAADVSDRYLLLCLRCKKVGVRDRLPYIREVSALRDALRADVAALRDLAVPVLALTDEELRAIERTPPGEVPRLAHEVLVTLREDLRRLVEVPIREDRPTARYALRLADRRANRAVTLLRTRALVQAQALLGPAESLAHAFSSAVNFFTGDYFNADEKLPPRVIRAVVDADRKYRSAAKRSWKEQ